MPRDVRSEELHEPTSSELRGGPAWKARRHEGDAVTLGLGDEVSLPCPLTAEAESTEAEDLGEAEDRGLDPRDGGHTQEPQNCSMTTL
mmetsp:Transcript_39121/g.70614  ORF Transcript_39121/g.70614 Transcript_39121/m.70614 type:complete len:88 (+) Transcript_39121:330-593(+)|eukprot:CAMPEP_0197700820 /NCGR_PEP_ID=MMETSP1338-20131121/122448_1 /TAXON_ID=43686 ORGANISM="Pelagodinium beii, Strain RCC1491" /NCGR_SAMPLE_ID=MMETSP1338 /ASSEMBLY_ACC=CAM_ASM_000754 /LENGTH=87 /DNA_ID=CAMNT_0043284461 /DNA_START=316 /DNA_END=579 /DNA_ORIENTATION=-